MANVLLFEFVCFSSSTEHGLFVCWSLYPFRFPLPFSHVRGLMCHSACLCFLSALLPSGGVLVPFILGGVGGVLLGVPRLSPAVRFSCGFLALPLSGGSVRVSVLRVRFRGRKMASCWPGKTVIPNSWVSPLWPRGCGRIPAAKSGPRFRPQKAGQNLAPLCGPCQVRRLACARSGQRGAVCIVEPSSWWCPPTFPSLRIAGVEQLYQVKRMIRGIGGALPSTYSQTSNGCSKHWDK